MQDLVTTVVVTIILVILICGIIFTLALFWTRILPRNMVPAHYLEEPISEKKWPGAARTQTNKTHTSKKSTDSEWSTSSPIPSPRNSKINTNRSSVRQWESR